MESSGGEKWAESGECGSRRSRMMGGSICSGVQAGCTSTGEQGCSGGVDEPFVTLDSAVEREEEREGNSGSGRGERQKSDGEMSCGVSSLSTMVSGGMYLSGSEGTTSVELQSGQAPGKDGVGEGAGIEKEKGEKERRKDRRCRQTFTGAAFGVK
jgi:hypothetical protein